jgi:N-acetylglucosaminyldiphosphoundecaprenol N-acetyl-beta-D-mannosaminyltransferase
MLEVIEPILHINVTRTKIESCIDDIMCGMESGRCRVLACANPHSLVQARRDPAFARALQHADMLVPDGVGIVLASRILGGAIRNRITGSDVFLQLSRRMNTHGGMSCFFLGSTEKNLGRIQRKFASEFPRVALAGTFSPPFKPVFDEADNRHMIEAVNDARPDVLWVGMTAPKQEKWIHQHRDMLQVKLIAAVGAVFDFYVGTVKRSPPWFLDHGLEWLPRLIQEPTRLWRRNFISTPLFLAMIVKDRIAKIKYHRLG